MENRLRSMYDHLNDLKNRLNTICNEFDQLLYDFTVQNPVMWNKSTGVTEATATAGAMQLSIIETAL